MARVLIVDDSSFMRTLLSAYLREEGHEVFEASTGSEALEVFRLERPEVVTMDITMPEVDGLTAAESILKEDETIRIIMCSALDQEQIIRRAVEMGVSDFITKPFSKQRIQAAVARVLERT